MAGLSPFERVGIRTLQTIQQEPLTTEQLRGVLHNAASGRLRCVSGEN